MLCNNEIGMTVSNNKRNQQLEKGGGKNALTTIVRMEGGARVECRIITRTHTRHILLSCTASPRVSACCLLSPYELQHPLQYYY